MQEGTKLFNRHNADNSTSGRGSVGEVVTTFTKEMGGKLRTIAVACMTKANAALYDVCSIEAEVNEDNGTVWDISKVTGIAVSNSSIDQPAFSNAKRMSIVQCFDGQGEPDYKSRKDLNMPVTLEDLMSAPIGLIQQAVKGRGMHPNQLFDLRDLEDDREFGDIIKDKRTAEDKVKDLETKLSDEQKKFAEVQGKTIQNDAQKLFDTKLNEKFSEKKITEKQKTFLSERFDPSKFEKADDATIDAYFEQGTKDYQSIAKIFGEDTGNTDDDNPGGSGEPQDVSIADAFAEE